MVWKPSQWYSRRAREFVTHSRWGSLYWSVKPWKGVYLDSYTVPSVCTVNGKPVRRYRRVYVIRPTANAAADPEDIKRRAGRDLATYPNLASFLYSPTYVGDVTVVREPGRIQIQPVAEGVRVTLKDPSSAVQAQLVLPSLDGLWKTLDAYLADPKARWTPDPYAKPVKAGRGR